MSPKLTRHDYNWVPDFEDENDYVWRNNHWQVDNRDDEEWTDEDEEQLEAHEERKRRRIAEQNEY